VLSTNASGPKRLLYGTARDLLIGIMVVHADGVISKAGGKVPKNVTGYDMMKLYIGSLGTLAVIAEATLKLRPLPPNQEIIWSTFASREAATTAAQDLLSSPLLPSAVEVVNPSVTAWLRQTLIDLVGRGVRVVVLVPGAIDHNIVRQASRAQFGEMILGGIEIFEYAPALLHSKTVVIDGVWATIGSTNFDNRSFAGNDELNLIVYDRGVSTRLEKVFLADVEASRVVTYEDWKHRGFSSKFLEVLAFPIRDLL